MSHHNAKKTSLWAKKSNNPDYDKWLPLHTHLNDTAEVACLLWDNWASKSVIKSISKGITADGLDGYLIAKQVFAFLAYVHDIGKATPVFQVKEAYGKEDLNDFTLNQIKKSGLPINHTYHYKQETRHELVGYMILKKHGLDDSVAVIIGSHHGIPPNENQINNIKHGIYDVNCGFDNLLWKSVQSEFFNNAIEFADLNKATVLSLGITRPVQVLLSGLLIMADWIASNEFLFKLINIEDSPLNINSLQRTTNAFQELKFPLPWYIDQEWNYLYYTRFGIESPHPVQIVAVEVAKSIHTPGIFIIEAPMGEGKTEAALAVAEIFAGNSSARGIYFALPSQATSNAMFTRVINWLRTFDNQEISVRLVHGKAEFNEEYNDIANLSDRSTEFIDNDINEENLEIIIHEWFKGRKKELLADFAVGTIDHVLMSGLKQKHLMLRHLGLAGKVLIIDECHAYDVYMESYLLKALNWLGAYGVPVVVLSATLPLSKRQNLIEAYLNKKNLGVDSEWAASLAYPMVTYSDGISVNHIPVTVPIAEKGTDVSIHSLNECEISDTLYRVLEKGGYAGVIFNTVKRAQEYYTKIKTSFEDAEVDLLHGGFLAIDRVKKEENLLLRLGKSNTIQRSEKYIVVGTQIFEQSLDIDFDVLITQLCPVDLLLQRIGRLHRHKRDNRPPGLKQPRCYVLGANGHDYDEGSAAIYSLYLLMRTVEALPQKINLPNDIPKLVAKVYSENDTEASINARIKWEERNEARKDSADIYQINRWKSSKTLINWLDMKIRDDSEKRAEAAVRDGVDSIEVLIIQKRQGLLCFLPWINNGEALPFTTPTPKLAKIIAGCSVRLPSYFAWRNIADRAILEIEEIMMQERIKSNWYESHWLKGALVMILDENQNVEICDCCINYDEQMGLSFIKKGDSNERN